MNNISPPSTLQTKQGSSTMNATTHSLENLMCFRNAHDYLFDQIRATRTEEAGFSAFQAKQLLDEIRAYSNSLERQYSDVFISSKDVEALKAVSLRIIGEVLDDEGIPDDALARVMLAHAHFFGRDEHATA